MHYIFRDYLCVIDIKEHQIHNRMFLNHVCRMLFIVLKLTTISSEINYIYTFLFRGVKNLDQIWYLLYVNEIWLLLQRRFFVFNIV